MTLAYGWALFTAFCAFILIVAGGLVTSTESGLSVPDWPTSYGGWFPPMVGGIRYEHSHRVIAGFVGICVLLLAIIVCRTDSRRWMRNLSLLALGGVALQAILGGLTVIYLLPLSVSVSHGCLGQALLATLCAIAFAQSPAWKNPAPVPVEIAPALRRLFFILTGAVSVQLILGAVVRHTEGHHVWWHIAGGCVVLTVSIAAFWTVLKTASNALAVRVIASIEFVLVLMQVCVGLMAYVLTIHVEQTPQPQNDAIIVATAHQTIGALILVSSVLGLLAVHRFVRPSGSSR